MDPNNLTKEYTNGEVTIVWQSGKCIHSGNCVRNNPDVFKPKEKPWITPEDSTTDKIIETIKKCPSGALTYYLNSEKQMVSYCAKTQVPLEKVWSDLLLKIEHPENFVPGVSRVLILEKTDESVIREMDVVMGDSVVTLKENITFRPYKVRFELLEHPSMEGYVDNDAKWLSENETEITFTAHWKNKSTQEEIDNFEIIKNAVIKTIAFIEKTL